MSLLAREGHAVCARAEQHAGVVANGEAYTRSCGCLSRETTARRNHRHGETANPAYVPWVAMLQRCTNPRRDAFRWYGARGIVVCERWRDFAAFLADMGPRPSPSHTIDRINPDGNYEPGNCRWATWAEQRRTQRNRGPTGTGVAPA